MLIVDNEIHFASGRKAYVNTGVIGLRAGDDQVCYGSDGALDWPPFRADSESLTAEDMRELAEHMITAWTVFRDRLK